MAIILGTAKVEERPRLLDVDFSQSPFLVIWQTTQACDLACLHCRAEARPSRDRGELSTLEAMRLMKDVRRFGRPLFVLTGGDPLEAEPFCTHVPARYARMVERGEAEEVDAYFADRIAGWKRPAPAHDDVTSRKIPASSGVSKGKLDR